MKTNVNKAWMWLVGAVAASTLMLGCASVQTGGTAKQEDKPEEVLADASAEEGSFWKDDEVIMKLGDTDITYGEMKKRYFAQTGGTKNLTSLARNIQLKYFNKYYYEQLFLKEAQLRKLDETQDFKDRVRASRYRLLEKLHKMEAFGDKVKPTEEYLQQMVPPAEDEVQVRVIVKKDLKEAQRVYQRALAEPDFVKICQEESEGFQRAEGGLSPWLSMHNYHKYTPPVVEKFLNQPIGTVLEPSYSEIGFLVVKVVNKRSAEAIKKDYLALMRAEWTYRYQDILYSEKLKTLKEQAKIDIKSDVVDAFIKGEGNPRDVIIEINGEKFLGSEVLQEMADVNHAGQPIVQRVNGFADTVVVAQDAADHGLDKSPEFLMAWTQETNSALAKELSRTTVVAVENEAIADKEIEDFVRANPEKFMLPESRLVLAIMTTDKNSAIEALEKLGKGEDFGEVAAKYSKLEESAKNGGVLGWSEKNALPTPFQEPMFTMNEGVYTKEPMELESNEGTPIFFILKVGGVAKPTPAPFERVNLRNAESKLRTQKRSKALDLLADELERKFGYKLCISDLRK